MYLRKLIPNIFTLRFPQNLNSPTSCVHLWIKSLMISSIAI